MHTALFPICASLLSSCILWTVFVLIWCRWWIKADTCWKGSRTCTCLWRQFGGQSVGEGKAKPSIGPFESAWAPICGDESCYKDCQPAQGTGRCRSNSHCHNHAWWSGLAVELGVYVIILTITCISCTSLWSFWECLIYIAVGKDYSIMTWIQHGFISTP